MAFKPVPRPFKDLGFTRLSSVAFLYQPPKTEYGTANGTTTSGPAPDLILFPSWMDAQPRHISKYLAEYQTLYPHSAILTINFSIKHSLRLFKSNQIKWYGPVVDYLVSLPKSSTILLHQVSNGGSFCIVAVASLYRERTGQALPLTAQVLDSTPGQPSFLSDIDAVVVGFPPNALIRAIGWALIFTLSALSYLFLFVMRREHMVVIVRKQLNNTEILRKAPRAYIYSKEDTMVAMTAVKRHVEESRALGWKVRDEEFKGSKHVAHMMLDRERYWEIVKAVWSDGLKT